MGAQRYPEPIMGTVFHAAPWPRQESQLSPDEALRCVGFDGLPEHE